MDNRVARLGHKRRSEFEPREEESAKDDPLSKHRFLYFLVNCHWLKEGKGMGWLGKQVIRSYEVRKAVWFLALSVGVRRGVRMCASGSYLKWVMGLNEGAEAA